MSHELLSKGIYAIINKKLKLVYVGETQRNFLIRFIEHLTRVPDYIDNLDRTNLVLDENTKFLVLKNMDSEEFTKTDFYKYEQQAYMNFIKLMDGE